MANLQHAFIEFALHHQVLKFGQFVLKSGRSSPYFFNTGLFNTGVALAKLGEFYAQAIVDSGIPFDMLFGPAYKGIPLATAVAIALAHRHQRDVPFACNRKEVKDHGEGGMLLGAPLQGRVLILDDVISAGTSVNLSVALIRRAEANPVGVVIALNRQERGRDRLSAIQEVREQHGLQVISLITLDDLVDYISAVPTMADHLDRIRRYRDEYGILD